MFVPAKKKQQAVTRIAQEMGVPDRRCSTGSTEPKEIFLDVIRGLGLQIDERLRKPELGQSIARAAGLAWDSKCDSRKSKSGGGDTVTLVGLNRVLEAVSILKAKGTVVGLAEDAVLAKQALAALPVVWEGKASVLEMKEVDYNWRQMEWWGFYFELKARSALAGIFTIPGKKYGTVTFDLSRSVNWDMKAKAIKSDDHRAILNDKTAMNASIAEHGEHGVILALCDVDYNDSDRSFQKWHTELKGGESKYEVARKIRTSASRYRKTRIELKEILFLRVDASNISYLDTMRQGRNSNGAARPEKYMLDLVQIEHFLVDRIKFAGASEDDVEEFEEVDEEYAADA